MKQISPLAVTLLVSLAFSLIAQPQTAKAQPQALASANSTIPLWPQVTPDVNGLTGVDADKAGGCVGNVSTATLSVYLPDEAKSNGTAVVLTPGGGYHVVCVDGEGHEIAQLLTERGCAAIVLKYRLPNQHHLIPANDARRAIRTVRHHAKQWKIDPAKVGVWGFSAGGHLASTVSTTFDAGLADAEDHIERQSSRPDFSILFYPVISMEPGVTHGGSRTNLLGPNASEDMIVRYSNERQVTKATPPTFILHAADDHVVPLENSLRYYKQLVANGIASRLIVYETGGHGPDAFKKNPTWLPVFEDWLAKR